MKNKILFLVLSLFSIIANADLFSAYTNPNNIYHVRSAAKGGSDANNCTAAKPCLTLAGAAAKVTRAGSIIHVHTNDGTFAETATTNLSVGVTIQCDGKTSNAITSNIAGANTISLVSTVEGTDGNQEIRNCKINGGLVGLNGIYIQGRSNVKIHDLSMDQWVANAVTFNGRADNSYDFAPIKFANGNEFYNNTITNSTRYSGSGGGALQYGGQDGILIYNNTIDVSGRGTSAVTGYPIKYYRGGYSKNDEIFNNTLTKPDMDGTGGFGFTIEPWHGLGGMKVYGNTMIGGAIDANSFDKGSSDFTLDFYNNRVGCAAMCTVVQVGVSLESTMNDVIIRNNYFYNLNAGGAAVYVYAHTGYQQFNNIKIFNNIVVDSRLTVFSASGTGSTASYNNWLIANNTIYRKSAGTQAIMLPRYGKASNVQVRNNIVSGFTTSAIEYDGGATSTLDNVIIENNLFYNNGASNLLKTSGATNMPTNVIVQNQINTDPVFVNTALSPPDLRIQVTSPAINKGIDVGISADYRGIRRTNLPDIGALEYDDSGAPTNLAQP